MPTDTSHTPINSSPHLLTFPFSYRKTTTLPSLAAVLRPLSTRQRPDEPPSRDTTEAQGRLTPQPHARISSDIRPCFLFLVHPIAPSASDEPFSFSPPHTAHPLPAHRVPESNPPRTRSPKSSPETAHIRPRETPQNHPFARPEKAASVNSYSKSAISYNAPPKVLPLTGACLLLHCHQDRNEIQIKK